MTVELSMNDKNQEIGAVKKAQYRQDNRRRLKSILKRMLAATPSYGLSLDRASIRRLVE
jgi:hypothetical protein